MSSNIPPKNPQQMNLQKTLPNWLEVHEELIFQP
jgi:hypothetical protein